MHDIRHLSFDMWGTLIDPNPRYGEAREKLLVEATGLRAKTVKSLYSLVKSEIDNSTECMADIAALTPFARLANLLATVVSWSTDPALRSPSAEELAAAFFAASEEHLPLVRPAVPQLMETLRAAGKTVSITSNTNFVIGATLQKLVEQWGDVVKFSIYSDELLVSKPDPVIFEHVLEGARAIHGTALKPNEIMHIGDNPICDIGGAAVVGMKPWFLGDNEELIQLANQFDYAPVN